MKSDLPTQTQITEPKIPESKAILFFALLLYACSVFGSDYFADVIGFKIREAFVDLLNTDSIFRSFRRFFLWDIVVEFGFFFIVCRAFGKNPESFFEFNIKGKTTKGILFNIFKTCIFTSFILALLFAIMQGLLYWIPEIVIDTINYNLYKSEVCLKKLGFKEVKSDQLVGFLKAFNLSLIFIITARLPIFLSIIRKLSNLKTYKILLSILLTAILLSWIVPAKKYTSYLIQSVGSRKYDEKNHSNYFWNEALEGAIKNCKTYPQFNIPKDRCEQEMIRLWYENYRDFLTTENRKKWKIDNISNIDNNNNSSHQSNLGKVTNINK